MTTVAELFDGSEDDLICYLRTDPTPVLKTLMAASGAASLTAKTWGSDPVFGISIHTEFATTSVNISLCAPKTWAIPELNATSPLYDTFQGTPDLWALSIGTDVRYRSILAAGGDPNKIAPHEILKILAASGAVVVIQSGRAPGDARFVHLGFLADVFPNIDRPYVAEAIAGSNAHIDALGRSEEFDPVTSGIESLTPFDAICAFETLPQMGQRIVDPVPFDFENLKCELAEILAAKN